MKIQPLLGLAHGQQPQLAIGATSGDTIAPGVNQLLSIGSSKHQQQSSFLMIENGGGETSTPSTINIGSGSSNKNLLMIESGGSVNGTVNSKKQNNNNNKARQMRDSLALNTVKKASMGLLIPAEEAKKNSNDNKEAKHGNVMKRSLTTESDDVQKQQQPKPKKVKKAEIEVQFFTFQIVFWPNTFKPIDDYHRRGWSCSPTEIIWIYFYNFKR